MSKAFDYIANGGGDVARAEAEAEYTAGLLGAAMEEIERLRAAGQALLTDMVEHASGDEYSISGDAYRAATEVFFGNGQPTAEKPK